MREIIAKMIIDDKQYENKGLTFSYAKTETQTSQPLSNHKNSTNMAFESILNDLSARAATAPVLAKTLKFDFGDNKIYIDGTGATNVVTTEDKEADCTVSVAAEDLRAMMDGALNPMNAFMGGKIKVQGDMSVAMKLQSLFKG
jgi:putative sterol carrier protein